MEKKERKFKQATMGAWKGFTLKVTHNKQKLEVKIPKTAAIEEEKVACLHCPKKFKTNSILAVHLKCKHPENQDLLINNFRSKLKAQGKNNHWCQFRH